MADELTIGALLASDPDTIGFAKRQYAVLVRRGDSDEFFNLKVVDFQNLIKSLDRSMRYQRVENSTERILYERWGNADSPAS